MKPGLTFGGWLKRRRGGLGLTQKELAEQAGYAHVTLRKVEADELRPSREMAERLAELLHIPPEQRTDFVRFARDQAHWDEVAALHELPPSPLVEIAAQPPPFMLVPVSAQRDWGDAPDVSGFCGRTAELQQLQQWLVNDRCKVVAVLGMGGIGKTALATAAAAQAQTDFSSVIWRSLRNALPLRELLGDCLRTLAGPDGYALPEATDKQLSLLLEHLRGQRCLLVLDNFETVLQGGAAGRYLPGYEGYGELLKQAGAGRHQSCLLLTSREKPPELIPLAGERSPVRTLGVHSLPIADARVLLHDRGLTGSDADWIALHGRYSGNPLALQIVAETIRELFAGDLAAFLGQDASLFGGIHDLLDQQFARLTALEREVMFWLAVEREPVGADDLADDFMQRPGTGALLGALHELRRRFLVESTHGSNPPGGYTLQNVVLEYVTAQLVERAGAELLRGEPVLLQHHALLKATAKSYVRETQRDLILKPLLAQVEAALGTDGVEAQLRALLAQLRRSLGRKPGYTAGNIFNLMVQAGVELRGKDFSRLSVRQADLRNVDAQDVNFASAGFEQCTFTDTFAIIRGLAFRPDDQQLAASTLGGDVRIWRVRDGQQLLGWTAHPNGARCLGYSPDGSLLATCGHRSIAIWDAADGRCLRSMAVEADVWSVCFSPDGRLIASGSSDRMARLWDWRSGECRHVLAGHLFDVQAVCFRPDGKLLVSGSEDAILRLWDTATGTCLRVLEGHTFGITAVCWAPSADLIASCAADETVRVWDAVTGECRHVFYGHAGWVWSVCFTPDSSSLISSGADATVRFWDLRTGRCAHILAGHRAGVRSVALSADGAVLATGSDEPSVCLWDQQSRRRLQTLSGYMNGILALSFSPQGDALAVVGDDPTVRIWNPNSGQSSHALRGHKVAVCSTGFDPSGGLLATADQDGEVRIWDANAGRRRHVLPRHKSVWLVRFSPDGSLLASGGGEPLVRLWNAHSGQLLHILEGHSDFVRDFSYSPDGALLASTSIDHTVRLWDTASGRCLHVLHGHTRDVWRVRFSPHGRVLASGGNDGKIRLWDTRTGRCLNTLHGHEDGVISVCFNPDGSLLASCSADQTARIWDTHTGECRCTLPAHTGGFDLTSFSPGGDLLATRSRGLTTVQLWNPHTGECVRVLEGQESKIMAMGFSPGGDLFATGGIDGTICLWDAGTGSRLRKLRGDRPYERMNIAGVTGITPAQVAALRALGAVEQP